MTSQLHAVAKAQPRAVIYLRQSVAREESISLELQENAGREYCKQQGYEVVAVEADPGISGRTWKRPAVQRVMSMIEQRQADLVVLWKWSRLSRSRLDWAVAADRVESVGGRIESATEPLDTTTSTGRLARGMLTEFAAFESERIGDVWKESQQRRRRNGLPAQGGARFGYDKDGQAFTINPTQGALLREMYELFLAGNGFTKIAYLLNEQGHRTKTGVMWTADKIRNTLDSGFGAGQIIQNFRGPDRTYWQGNHEPLISKAEWDAYLVRREVNRKLPGKTISATYPLTGLCKCGDCGANMRAFRRNNKPGLCCSKYLDTRSVRLVTASMQRAEDAVFSWLLNIAEDIDALTKLESEAKQHLEVAIIDKATIEKKLVKLHEQMGRIAIKFADGAFPEMAFNAAMQKLTVEVESMQERLKTATGNTREASLARQDIVGLVTAWPELTNPEKNALLRTVIDHVIVTPPPKIRQGGDGLVTFTIVPRWAE